jgi:hypothetical protein
MTIIHNENFDSTAVGSLPLGWTAKLGNAWAVTSAAFVSSPNGLTSTSGDGAWITYTGGGALLDMEARFDWNPHATDSALGVVVRGSTDGQNGYFVNPSASTNLNGSWTIYKTVGGAFTQLSSFNLLSSITGNVSVRIRVQGTTINANVWPYGTTEPTGWMATASDSSVSTAGYAGLRNQGGTATATADNFTLDNLAAAASDFTFGPSSLMASPGSATSNYTVTPNGSPSSAVSVALSDGGAGGLFSPSSLSFTTGTAQTFTYTPRSDATVSPILLTATATGGFSAAHTAQCVLNVPATDFALTPPSLTASPLVASGNYSIALNGTLSANETIMLSDGSAGGTFSPSSLTFTSGNAGTPQAFKYTPAAGTAGTTKTLAASATGQFSANHSVACVVSSGPTPGTIFSTYVGVTETLLSSTEAIFGSDSFTHQWYRSTTSGSNGSAINGATSESLVDAGLSAMTDYYYSLLYTDTTTNAQVFSAQVHVRTLAASVAEVIGGIGDSIMAGSFSAVETPFNAMIDQLNYKLVGKQFTGINRAISGTTSSDWSSTTSGSNLINAVAAFVAGGVTKVVLMLGSNDSKASVVTPTGTYASNISAILAYLFENVSTLKTIHLFSSPFQSLASGDLSIQNCGRVIAYANALAGLANGTTIFFS